MLARIPSYFDPLCQHNAILQVMVVGGWARRCSGVNDLTHNGHGSITKTIQVLVSLVPLLSAKSSDPHGSTCVNKYDSHSLLFRPILVCHMLILFPSRPAGNSTVTGYCDRGLIARVLLSTGRYCLFLLLG